MLSYQHAYHAGCLADVHKHMAQLLLLQAMTQSHKRLTYIETHSGRGLYRLNSVEAEKTGEAKAGILHLQQQNRLPADAPYSQLLKKVRGQYGQHAYPGSPLIAQMTLRPEDSLNLFELHPAEGAALMRNIKGRNIRIHKQDGYAGALRLCPPVPRNGLVMIDPSFEVKSEYALAVEFIRKLLRKWPNAVVLLWYPMLKAAHHEVLLELAQKADFPGYWHQQIRFCAPEEVRGMYGSGLVAVNLPTQMLAPLGELPQIFG